jgi:hypothetical protein
MSNWHVYPGFIRLVDNSHVPVVLILDVDQRVMVRADVADTADAVPELAGQLLKSRDLPDTVIHLDSPIFPGLVNVLDNVLSGTRHRPHRVATIDGDELEWVLDEGRRVIKAVEARKPSSAHDVSKALHAELHPAREQLR